MKSFSAIPLLFWSLRVRQAFAFYKWGDAPAYQSPERANNQCSPEQSNGWTFGQIPDGQVSSFDGMDFSGFTCRSSSSARPRWAAAKQEQVSAKRLIGQATHDDASCPTISSQTRGFSMSKLVISTNQTARLIFEYIMPNGDICQQQSWCSPQGTTIQNKQCGDAQQVKIKGDGEVSLHSVDFNCESPQPPIESLSGGITTTPPGTSLVTTSLATTSHAETTTSPTSTDTTTFSSSFCTESGSIADQGSCVLPSTTGGITTPFTTGATSTLTTMATMATVTSSTGTSCGEGAMTGNQGSCPATTVLTTTSSTTECGGPCESPTPVRTPNTTSSMGVSVPTIDLTTVTTLTSLTTCPVTITSGTVTWVTQTVSNITVTSTATTCPNCGMTTSPTSVSTASSAEPNGGGSVAEAPYPSVLPRCLNTWMYQAVSCANNSDTACFCSSPTFVAFVQECVSAWARDDGASRLAFSFLAGICAEHIQENPGICAGVSRPIASALSVPSTTVSLTQTLASGTITTRLVIIPQVAFSTVAESVTATQPYATGAGITQMVGLVPVPISVSASASTEPTGMHTSSGSPSSTTPRASDHSLGSASSTDGESNPVSTQGGPLQSFTGSGTRTGKGMGFVVFAVMALWA